MTEFTPNPANQASANLTEIVTLLQAQLQQLQLALEQFFQQPITPAHFYHLETHLQTQLQAAGRLLLEHALHQLEPATLDQARPRITFQNETYRRRPQQPKTIYSSFA